jgi:hypothetical protein
VVNAISRAICGDGIMKLSALLIAMISNSDLATTIVVTEVVIGTIIILNVKVAIKTITIEVVVTQSPIISEKMVKKGISNVVGISRERVEIRLDLVAGTNRETVIKKVIGNIKSTLEVATMMVCKDLVAVIRKDTDSIRSILEVKTKREGTNLVVGINKEKVAVNKRGDTGKQTSIPEVAVSKLMDSKKCVVMAMATTVANSNSVVGTRTTSNRGLTNKSKVKARLVTSIRRMTDRSAPCNSNKKPLLLL